MVGFSNIQPSFEGHFKCSKPDISSSTAGPAKIKRKKPTLKNPWANLGGENDSNDQAKSNLINEDELMTKGEDTAKTQAKKFCGSGDTMQAPKPCANCNCGLKE